MKIILSLLAVAFVFLAAGAALGSDVNDEWSGDWSYECRFQRDGRAARKTMRADNKPEAECKLRVWAAKNKASIAEESCQCAGECE